MFQLGKLVKKISKQCTHFLVKRAALDTLDVWKAVVSAEASAGPAPNPSPASGTDAGKKPSGSGTEGGGRKERERNTGSDKEREKEKEGKRKSSALEGSPTLESFRSDGSEKGRGVRNGEEGSRSQGESKRESQEDPKGGSKFGRDSGMKNGGEDGGKAGANEGGGEGGLVMELVVGEVKHCGDTTRDRLRTLVCDALCLAGPELEGWEMEQARQLVVAELAVKIEKELWNRFGAAKDLKVCRRESLSPHCSCTLAFSMCRVLMLMFLLYVFSLASEEPVYPLPPPFPCFLFMHCSASVSGAQEYKATWGPLHFNLRNPQNPPGAPPPSLTTRLLSFMYSSTVYLIVVRRSTRPSGGRFTST